jgi:predicted ATPase/class 3 adenylate cyclase
VTNPSIHSGGHSGQLLPSGTVTFLFTDIEGSTKLAREHPETWEIARARHHAILREAIECYQGYVFQIIGDAFCAAFHTAKDGLAAATESQRKLQTEYWDDTPLRVRMGIHTGAAERNGNDYRGYLTMVKVQRVMSVAYGGQILVSNTSAELLSDELPRGITLRDMKDHRLKGLPDPEHLWQVIAPDLQQDFPALQSITEIPNNLPVQLTSFIGRKKEVGQIKKQLEKHPLVTLTGSGGVGKTRLSIQVALELLEAYPNGVWLVELAPLTDPALVTQTVCTVLNVSPQGSLPAWNALTDYLKPKKILLIVDNCEHLIDTCSQFCDSLLHSCPDLRIIASSREALGIEGESAYHVPSLSLPDPKRGWAAIQESEAVKLFLERATTVLPEFELTESNAAAIAQICQRLDGIALAIELAASRLKILRVEQIASRLDDAFRLLTGGSRTALPRQQTLRALIDWSYNLLSEEERAALRKLSVFMGGWTLEAAEAICAHPNMLDLLTHLVDKSLVAVDREHGDELRYYLLETIRQYAREKLAESGETAPIRDRHSSHFLALAERAEPEVHEAEQRLWLDRLEAELDNFRVALEWSLERGETGAESATRMASSLWWFWFIRGYPEERQWMERALHTSHVSAHPVIRAKLLSRLPWVHFFDEAYASEALALGRTLERAGQGSVALALLGKSAWAFYRADYAEAKSLAEESLRLFRELNDRWAICETLGWLGIALISLEEYQQAVAYLEESLKLAEGAGDGNEIGFALWQLGRVAMARGDYSQAMNLMTEALAVYKMLKLHGGIHFLLSDLGKAAVKKGDYEQALSYYKEGLAVHLQWGSERSIAESLEQLATVAMMHQHSEHAARLLGAAETLRQSSGFALFPYQHAEYELTFALLREQLDEATCQSRWAEGRLMRMDEAVAYALKELQ